MTTSRLKRVGGTSRHCRGKRPHLLLRGESPAFSVVAAGNGVPLIYDMALRDRLVLPQESQVSKRVARGLSGIFSSRCWGLGPYLELRPTPGLLSRAEMDLRVPMEFQQGIQASSPVETCKSAFLLNYKSSFCSLCRAGHRDSSGLSLKVSQGCHTSHCVLS